MTSVEPSLELWIPADGGPIAVPLTAGREVIVGRDEGCEARVADPSVSRRHASLRLDGVRVRVRDLESANGTFVREQGVGLATHRLRAIARETEVDVGATLHFGSVAATVRRVAGRAEGVVLRDRAMLAVYEQATRAASALISVLVLGETGVGKELLARSIHDRSPRAARPFLALNCAALPPELLESELFGHERGAFTGATHSQVGLFQAASGGTLFLDEVGELPPVVQVKLLRVLEERAVLPVGARSPRPVDVRLVSATNRDLEAECDAGRFRRDLFYRLNGMALVVPPLRVRTGELRALAERFLATAAAMMMRAVPRLDDEAARALERHAWPGNVRELKNAMERAVVLCDDVVRVEHLPPAVVARRAEGAGSSLRHQIADLERARVLEALERCGGNQGEAAKMLGVSRRTLVSRLTEYGLTRRRG